MRESMEEMRKKKGNGIAWICGVIMVALAVGVMTLVGSYIIYGGLEEQTGEGTEERVYTQLSSTSTITRVEEGGIEDLSGIVDQTMPSIVAITSTTMTTYYNIWGTYDQESEGSGSGILYGQTEEELLIATNNHVIADSKKIQITFFDDTVAEGSVKGTDSYADLALVSVPLSELSEETKAGIRIASLGTTEECKVGQMVLAIGNALGYGQSLTVGYVSAKEREVYVDGRTMTLLQTDAAINPGNSGGALINMQGEVVGINSVKYSAESVEGMGYAIPMEEALPILNELRDRDDVAEEEKGYLGVYYEAVSQEMNQIYQVPYGLYISEVIRGSAAEEAGLYQGDVITAIDGRELKDTSSLQEYMQTKKQGDQVSLTIQRYFRGGYREMVVEVVLKGNPLQP